MKILFDTNVLVSAFVSRGGHCYEILDRAIHDRELYCTSFIVNELKKVLRNNFHFSGKLISEIIQFIEKFFTMGETADTIPAICRDPEDDQILADALENSIDILITGDKDLLDLKNYRGVRIIRPSEYWNLT